MGTYIFSIKRSQGLKLSQILAWKRVRSRAAAGMGWGWRKEQAGTMISEGNDPTPSLLFSQSASRFCTLRAGSGQAGGRDRQVTPGPCPAVAFPAQVLPLRRCVAGGPPRTAEVGTWPGSWGANPGTRNLSLAGAPRRGRGVGAQKRDPSGPRARPRLNGRRGGGGARLGDTSACPATAARLLPPAF